MSINKYLAWFLLIFKNCLVKAVHLTPPPHKKINTLYRRVVVTIVIVFATSIMLIAFLSDTLILESFKRLEMHYTQEHLKRLEKAIEQDMAELAVTAADWGPWDDTYLFMENPSNDYIATNLTESVFHNLNLNMMVFFNPAGAVVFARGKDLVNDRFMAVPEKLIEQLENNRTFYSSEMDYTIRGLLMLPENPVLVASHTIVTSTLEGPVRGHLLVGRFLNDVEVSHYEQLLNIDIAVSSIDGSNLPQQNEESAYYIQELSEESIAAYTILDDIFGQPATVLRINIPREISTIGTITTRYLFVSLAGASLAIALAILVLLKRYVFLRLAKISEEVSLIGNSKSFSARLTADRENDELTIVTDAINAMLGKLEQSQQQITDSERRYRLITENTTDTIFLLDLNLKINYVSPSVINLRGYSAAETAQQSLNEIFAMNLDDSILQMISDETNIHERLNHVLNSSRTVEAEITRKDGTTAWVVNTISLAWDEHEKHPGILVVTREITEAKRAMEKLKYLSLHDQLTGLYNRAFFEAEIERMDHSRYYPITIISADLDGLKLVNDTMGHNQGNLLLQSAADILTKSFRSSDIICRVGGDEFAVILPHTDAATAEMLATRIRANIKQFDNISRCIPLSISFGLATTQTSETSLDELSKQADDLMYKDKLCRNTSNRNRIVQSLLAALSERDYIAEAHAQRLTNLCQIMGDKLNLTSWQLADLSLLAQVHDLGKVGIPDAILYKEGPLDKEEWAIMRKHPEMGYRIAITSPDLVSVAELILKHHEKWDGSGYPLGIKGEEIPVECRILSIVDTFDAITHDRPYRKAGSRQEAMEEIRKHAGTQFDPALADLFINLLDDLYL